MTVRDLRRGNRSVVLSTLFFDGPLSRQEVSQRTGLSPATVSNVTGQLIEERLLVEAGMVDSDGGRPRILLRVNPDHAYVVGVDVGETGVKIELFDLAMVTLATVDYPFETARPEPGAAAEHVLVGLSEVLAQSGVAEETLLGVGVGVFGIVAHEPEATVHAQTLGWHDVPFERLLRAGTALPLFIDNGAKTLGQAEMWFGAGRGARHAVIALIGSGVGAAIITHGSTYRGASSSAGEWGHTTLVHGGRRCRCGSYGCLEAYVGAEAILDRYRQARRRAFPPGTTEQAAIDLLIEAAATSKAAARVLAETAEYLGSGIADLINLFNPERIVLAGWAGLALGARLLPEIRAAAKAHALHHPYGQTSIELGRLGPDAVAFGAATLPIGDLLARGAGRPVSEIAG
ncbi:MAG TPA: ROK family transcriptional regulator [Pilimelia sp.]|nr:ROK family transcriptional regulator [Pilimelia sp.]